MAAAELTLAFACRFSSSTEQSSASRLMRRHKRRRRKQKAPRIERVPGRGWVSWGAQCRAGCAHRDSAVFAVYLALDKCPSAETLKSAVNLFQINVASRAGTIGLVPAVERL